MRPERTSRGGGTDGWTCGLGAPDGVGATSWDGGDLRGKGGDQQDGGEARRDWGPPPPSLTAQ